MKAALIASSSGEILCTTQVTDVPGKKNDFLDKAAVTGQATGNNRLRIVEVPDPIAGPDDLLIRVEHISIEGGDLMFRRVGMGGRNNVLGYSAAGEIVAVGENVQGFSVGQKVTTFAADGSHATLRSAPAATCFHIPEGLDPAVAAAIPVAAGTAGRAMDLSGVGRDDTVMITGAAGGLGIAAVQLAALRGARVIATGTNAATLEKTRGYGATDTIVSRDEPTSVQVRKLLDGNKVTVLIDTIGGPVLGDAIETMSDHGRVVLLGGFAGLEQKIDAGQLLLRQLTVSDCLFGEEMGEPHNHAMIVRLLQSAATGALRVPIDRIFPFEEIDAAHARAEERGRFGRVIVTV